MAYPVTFRDGLFEAALEGPDNPFLKQPSEKVRADFTARRDRSANAVMS